MVQSDPPPEETVKKEEEERNKKLTMAEKFPFLKNAPKANPALADQDVMSVKPFGIGVRRCVSLCDSRQR